MSRFRLVRSWPLGSRPTALVALLALLATHGGLPACVMSRMDATRRCSEHRAEEMPTALATRASLVSSTPLAVRHDCHASGTALGCASGAPCSSIQPSAAAPIAATPLVAAPRVDLIVLDSCGRVSFLSPPAPPPPRV